MNNWYEALIDECYKEHDAFCAYGVDCGTRSTHVTSAYVAPSLRDMVDAMRGEINGLRIARDTAMDESTHTAEKVKAVRALHYAVDATLHQGDHCAECQTPWPCATYEALV